MITFKLTRLQFREALLAGLLAEGCVTEAVLKDLNPDHVVKIWPMLDDGGPIRAAEEIEITIGAASCVSGSTPPRSREGEI